jgi:hypothetical protein
MHAYSGMMMASIQPHGSTPFPSPDRAHRHTDTQTPQPNLLPSHPPTPDPHPTTPRLPSGQTCGVFCPWGKAPGMASVAKWFPKPHRYSSPCFLPLPFLLLLLLLLLVVVVVLVVDAMAC